MSQISELHTNFVSNARKHCIKAGCMDLNVISYELFIVTVAFCLGLVIGSER